VNVHWELSNLLMSRTMLGAMSTILSWIAAFVVWVHFTAHNFQLSNSCWLCIITTPSGCVDVTVLPVIKESKHCSSSIYNSQDHTAMFFKYIHCYCIYIQVEKREWNNCDTRHFSRDQRVLSVLKNLTHSSVGITDIHTTFTIGNVHKSMRYALKFTISLW